MNFPKNYFQPPTRRMTKMGIEAEVEMPWGNVTIFNKNGKIKVDAYNWRGKQQTWANRQFASIDEAKQTVWENTRPNEDIIF